jgi:hypothetical protein
VGLNLLAVVPLLVVFFLMVQKPELPRFRAASSETGARSARVNAP